MVRTMTTPAPAPGRKAFARITPCVFVALLAALSASSSLAAEKVPADEFSRLVQMAPFTVKGKQLSISVHARTSRDRRYATGFAEEVVKVVCESGVVPDTGKGLVIIGQKGEPHPLHVFRQFIALAAAGRLDPAIAARAPELSAMLQRWEQNSDQGGSKDGKRGGEVDLEFEKIFAALPLPLEGIGAPVYQLAWAEKFDPAKVEARLCALRPEDLGRRDLFARYDWVFYLPPRGAFDQVLDELIAEALKEEEVGFVGRMAVKGVLVVVKPKIRQAIEALRHGLMFQAVTRARTQLADAEVHELMEAYIEEVMPFGDHKRTGSVDERAVVAVRERWEKLRQQPAAALAEKVPAEKPAGQSDPGA